LSISRHDDELEGTFQHLPTPVAARVPVACHRKDDGLQPNIVKCVRFQVLTAANIMFRIVILHGSISQKTILNIVKCIQKRDEERISEVLL
jgi:hypothetical protein